MIVCRAKYGREGACGSDGQCRARRMVCGGIVEWSLGVVDEVCVHSKFGVFFFFFLGCFFFFFCFLCFFFFKQKTAYEILA